MASCPEGAPVAGEAIPEILLLSCRWRLGSIRTYNPEQIMLSAAVRRSSQDVKIMKEKLIFSGGDGAGPCLSCHPPEGGAALHSGVFSCCGSGDWADLGGYRHGSRGLEWDDPEVPFQPKPFCGSVAHPKLVQV